MSLAKQFHVTQMILKDSDLVTVVQLCLQNVLEWSTAKQKKKSKINKTVMTTTTTKKALSKD